MPTWASKLTRQRTERMLWIVAGFCFGVIAWTRIIACRAGDSSSRFPNASISSLQDLPTGGRHPGEVSKDSTVIGRLRIRSLGLVVPVTSGVESSSLLRGVGHVEGTALPGGLGTVALAGHRDTFFRPLERIGKNMDIEVSDRSGTYHYLVDSWEVVTPDEVGVLSIRARPQLVLITCYPFHYVGAAPNRFVVYAHLVSLSPDSAP